MPRQLLWLVGVLLNLVIITAPAQTLVVADDHYGITFGKLLQVEASGVLDNDTLDGEPAGENGATAELVIGPLHGTLECPTDSMLALCPDGSFDYSPDANFPGSDSFEYLAVAGAVMSTATVTLSACAGGPLTYACWHKSAFLSLLTELGYSSFREGFEGNAWDIARSPLTASSVTSKGITWTTNYPSTNNITTGLGAVRTGSYGVYDPQHGFATGTTAQCDVDVPAESCLYHDGFRGSRVPGQENLHGVGGYTTGMYGNNMSIFLDDTLEIGFGDMPGNQHQFIGVIDDSPGGFRSYEFREMDGKVGQKFLIWGDDFFFAIIPPVIDCSGDTVTVSNVTIPFGITECIATGSITIGPDVLVLPGAVFWLDAPIVDIISDVTVEVGATIHVGAIP